MSHGPDAVEAPLSRPTAPQAQAPLAGQWLADPLAASAVEVERRSTGERLLLAGRQRLIVHADGSVSAARQWLPAEGFEVAPLPARMAARYLLRSRGEPTLVYVAADYLADPEPIAHLEFETGPLVPGFDRLYALHARSREAVALGLEGEGVVDPAPLPAAPHYGEMAFFDDWFAAVEVPFQGILVTFDAGASWHPTGLAGALGVTREPLGLRFRMTDEDQLLTPDGSLLAVSDPAHQAPSSPSERLDASDARDDHATAGASLLAGKRPLLGEALLSGVADTPGTLLLYRQGTLHRLRQSDGAPLMTRRTAIASGGDCVGVRVGESPGFVCTSPLETEIFRVSEGSRLERIHAFAGARRVVPQATGVLLVRGGCAREALRQGDKPRPRTVCSLDGRSPARELELPEAVPDTRLVALPDGRLAALQPPSHGKPGLLHLRQPQGGWRQVRMELPSNAGADLATTVATEGYWLDRWRSGPEGALTGWAARGQEFVGLRITRDGKVEVGTPKGTLDGALLAGAEGLVLMGSGAAWETTDSGFSWRRVQLPDAELWPTTVADSARPLQGCSALGCVVGGWWRVGWSRRGKVTHLGETMAISPTRLPAARGSRWHYDCTASGKDWGQRWREGAEGEWPSFLGVPAPRVSADQRWTYSSTRGTAELRAYAWAEQQAGGTLSGSWLMRVAPFDSNAAPWSTTRARLPWKDRQALAHALGGEVPSGSTASWELTLDAGGERGLLRLGSSTHWELFVVGRNRGALPLASNASLDHRAILGVAALSHDLYFAVEAGAEAIRIYRIDNQNARPVLTLRDVDPGSTVELVRNTDETALGLWVRDEKLRGTATRWFVYPIDMDEQRAETPLALDDDALGATPAPCRVGAAGWLLSGNPPVAPSLELPPQAGADGTPSGTRFKLIATPTGLCAGALSARWDLEPRRPAKPQADRSEGARGHVPLTVRGGSDRARRWRLDCSP